MPIDPIGKKGPLPTAPETGGAGGARPAEASRPFEVRGQTPGSERADAPAAAAPASPSPLDRLRAGQIDVNGYVDQKLDEATAHLHGLGTKELSALKEILRAQIVSDPALVDLVTQAAGATPPED